AMIPVQAGLPLVRRAGEPGTSKSPVSVNPPLSVTFSPSNCCNEPSIRPLPFRLGACRTVTARLVGCAGAVIAPASMRAAPRPAPRNLKIRDPGKILAAEVVASGLWPENRRFAVTQSRHSLDATRLAVDL